MSAPSPLPEGVRRDLERMAGPLAERMLPPRVTQSATTRNVVAAVNDDGTVDVMMGGAVMQHVPATTACVGVAVGDEVIVEQYGPRLYCVGVVAKSLDNRAYVSWTDLWRSGTKYVSYMCDGSSVWLAWNVTQEDTTYWVAGTLPEELWPEKPVWAAAVMASDRGYVRNNTSMCYVGVNGQAGFQQGAAVSGARNCGLASWPLRAADASKPGEKSVSLT